MNRKKFFKSGVKGIIGNLLKDNPVGQAVDRQLLELANVLTPEGPRSSVSKPGNPLLSKKNAPFEPPGLQFPRPPGALHDPVAFNEECNRCGDCMAECPYGAIFSLSASSGPVLNPNFVACFLCHDYPCIKSCKTGALQKLPPGTLPGFGVAHLIKQNCVNQKKTKSTRPAGKKGELCEECLKACPIEDAISFSKKNLPEFQSFCNGCGQCVHRCPATPVAIKVIY